MPLLIAFSSYRRRGDAPDIYFYEHDGKSQGKLVEALPTETVRNRGDYRPCLSAEGALLAFSCQYREGVTGELRLWDRKEKKLLPVAEHHPGAADAQSALSADGRWLVFTSWRRPGGMGGHDIVLHDLKEQKLVALPGLNTEFDEQMPTISGDGRWIAFTSNRPYSPGGPAGLSRVYLYDRQAQALVSLPGLERAGSRDTEPWLSADGRWLAFASNRPSADDAGGSGDIYLYDRQKSALVPLPGLNSAGHDCQPALSPGGRYLVFTSERLDGAGQRDIYLYDRREQKLLPTPGMNDSGEEFEPCVICLDPALDTV